MAGLHALKHVLVGGVLASALVGCDAQTTDHAEQPCAYDKESYAYELATLILDPDAPDARVQFREELAAATRRGESAVGISRDYIFLHNSDRKIHVLDQFKALVLGKNHVPIVTVHTFDETIPEAFQMADQHYAKSVPNKPAPRLSYVFSNPVVDGIPFGNTDALEKIRKSFQQKGEYALPATGEWHWPFGICRFHEGVNDQGKMSIFAFGVSGSTINCFIYTYLVSMGLRGPSLEDHPPTMSYREPYLLAPAIMIDVMRFIYDQEETLSEDERVQVGMDFCALYRAAEIWKPRIRI